jgi:predicted proteasome-type protease
MYQVTEKAVPPVAAGERYTVENPDEGVSWFRKITVYRTPHGRVVAIDATGDVITSDGDVFRLVQAAVEKYDEEHPA